MSSYLAAFRLQRFDFLCPEKGEKGEKSKEDKKPRGSAALRAVLFGKSPAEYSRKRLFGDFSTDAAPNNQALERAETLEFLAVNDYSPFPPLSGDEGLEKSFCSEGCPARVATVSAERVAALRRMPSWSNAADVPSAGAWCSCCKGSRWWCEVIDPKGWRCCICHPPIGARAGSTLEMVASNTV